ncbi:hypothetical protein [Helicobacter pylori]|uniref:hypothetical protein n=1 Tax=Helicobacter pylori TaxID=210 RepID=UPI00165B850A|nr:hypothetical protein [Helicobacter pylori]MBH0250394.1 hypothetical protein [Helicobacter pylori]
MSKIKPQIKKNNPSKSHFSDGWHLFGAAGLGLEKWCLRYWVGLRVRKNNHELFKNLIL